MTKQILSSVLLGAFFLVGTASLHGGTQIIAYGQDVPGQDGSSLKLPLKNLLVERIFDRLFEIGVVAFDVDLGESGEWTARYPEKCLELAAVNGAKQAIYFHLYWKSAGEKGLALERLVYSVVDARSGRELTKGLLTPRHFFSPDPDEKAQSEDLAKALLAEIGGFF